MARTRTTGAGGSWAAAAGWAAAAAVLAVAGANACSFCARGPGGDGATATFDLSNLPAATFPLGGALRNGTANSQSFLVSSPCLLASSASCGPTAGPMTQSCKPVGRLEPSGPNSTIVELTAAGFDLTLRGGFDVPALPHGRNAVYRFVCDEGAGPAAGPEPGVVESPAGFYRVTWRTAAACKPARGRGACPPPPPPPKPCTPGECRCTDDVGCSLNGACDTLTGRCGCRAPWTGTECHLLAFKPASFPQGYGMSPNITTWGGGALYDPAAGLYHLYASRMTNDCSLAYWPHNSRIDHAVSTTITGPYAFRDVAVPTWAHNSAPVALPDGTFAIFHIGNGTAGPDGGHNCTRAGVSAGPSRWRAGAAAAQPPGFPWTTIHVSRSLDGPWAPVRTPPSGGLGQCNNVAPWVHPNGTIFAVCVNGFLLRRSQSVHGPWTTVATVPPLGEDPYIYTDTEGHFHVLYHRFQQAPADQCVNSTVSAHAFSKDGLDWHAHPVQPYSTQVAMRSGEVITVATRERPKLFFNEDGVPTHLFNGVCSAARCTRGGLPWGCVNCKNDNWDYTLVLELDLHVDR